MMDNSTVLQMRLNAILAKKTAPTQERKKYKFKPLNVPIDYSIDCHQYLSDASEQLRKILEGERLTIIDAATRAGKTTFFCREYAPNLAVPFVMILVLPLRMPTDQIAAKSGLPYNSGLFESQIMTFQMFEAFAKMYTDELRFVHLVIDEIHELVKSAGYRKNIVEFLDGATKLVHKVIGLSGTPITPFSYLGYKNIRVNQVNSPKIVSRVVETTKADLLGVLRDYLFRHEHDTVLVFVSSRAVAETYEKTFGILGLKTAYVTSENKLGSTEMRELIETENLQGELKLFCTPVLENGVAVKNARILYINTDGCDLIRIWQSLSRCTSDGERYLDILNIADGRTKTGDVKDFDFSAIESEKNNLSQYAKELNFFMKRHADTVKDTAKSYTLINQQALPKGVYFDRILGDYTVSLLPLFCEQYARIAGSHGLGEIVDYLDKHTDFKGVERLCKSEDSELEGQFQEVKNALTTAKAAVLETAQKWLQCEMDRCLMFAILKEKTENQYLRANLSAYKAPTETPSDFEIIAKNLAIFELIAMRYVRLKKATIGSMDKENLHVFLTEKSAVFNMKIKQIGIQIYDILFGLYGDSLPYEISDRLAILKAQKYNELNRVRLSLQNGLPLPFEVTAESAKKIIGELDSDFSDCEISGKMVVEYLSVLFDVTPKRRGKKHEKIYVLSAIGNAGFDKEKFLENFNLII